jgi:hypothetical protein
VERNARVETFQNRRDWPSRHVVEEEGRHHDPHTTQTPTHAHPLTAPTPSHQVAYFYDSEVGNFYYGQVRRSHSTFHIHLSQLFERTPVPFTMRYDDRIIAGVDYQNHHQLQHPL